MVLRYLRFQLCDCKVIISCFWSAYERVQSVRFVFNGPNRDVSECNLTRLCFTRQNTSLVFNKTYFNSQEWFRFTYTDTMTEIHKEQNGRLKSPPTVQSPKTAIQKDLLNVLYWGRGNKCHGWRRRQCSGLPPLCLLLCSSQAPSGLCQPAQKYFGTEMITTKIRGMGGGGVRSMGLFPRPQYSHLKKFTHL
jgi:hypothetical protein